MCCYSFYTDSFVSKKREQEQKKALKKMQEQDDNMTEIANAIFSDLLTENPDQAISAFGANRIIAERWKGMTAEAKEQIRKKQIEQVEERKVRKKNIIQTLLAPNVAHKAINLKNYFSLPQKSVNSNKNVCRMKNGTSVV